MLEHVISLSDQAASATQNTGTWLDKLALGGGVTVLGMVVVFLGLISLIVIMVIYPKFVFAGINAATKRKEKAQAKKAEKLAEKKAAAQQTVIQKPVAVEIANSTGDDEAVIAAITAAVAASMGKSANGVVIKSIERTGQNVPAWGARGRIEQVLNRF